MDPRCSLSLVVVVVVMMSREVPIWGGRCLEKMRNSTRLSLSWNTSVMSMESAKYHWRSAAHFGQKRSKYSLFSCLLSITQWEQIEDVIWPMKAWYEVVEVSLTYIALRSSSPCQDNGQQEFAICACL